MRSKIFPLAILLLLVTMALHKVAAQSASVSLQQINEQVETFIQKSRGWKHETADPPTPPGGRPSTDVTIHFWSAEKCLAAGLTINGKPYGTQPVACRIKLAIDQSESAIMAQTRLSNFVFSSREENFVPIAIGDKGYVWNGSTIIFIKGRFTFTLSGGADLKIGDFSINRELIEKLANDIARLSPANRRLKRTRLSAG